MDPDKISGVIKAVADNPDATKLLLSAVPAQHVEFWSRAEESAADSCGFHGAV
jgi:hypothetical protein